MIDSYRSHHKPTPCRRAWKLPRGHKARNMRVTKRRHHLAVRARTHLLTLFRVRPTCPHALLKPLVLAIGSRPPGQGR